MSHKSTSAPIPANTAPNATARRIAVATAIFAGVILSTSAFAGNTDPSRTQGASTTPSTGTANPDSSHMGATPLNAVLIAGAMTGSTVSFSVVRIANSGAASGTATIEFIDPSSGKSVATWTSQDIPAHGGTQQRLDTISAGATLDPTVTTLPAVVNLAVSATFPGTVQHLTGGGSGILADASACGSATTAPRERIAFVPIDASQTHAWVRIVNAGDDTETANLVVRDAATGLSVGTWTSPSVPGHSATTVALGTLLTDASVAAGPTGFTIDGDRLPKAMRLELAAADITSGGFADQTVSCALPGSSD